MNRITSVYKRLLAFHGPQGWWPIVNASTLRSEYHLGAPRDEKDFFEISIGAILTQNIAWKNVDTALAAMKKRGILDPLSIQRVRLQTLGTIIRPTGYYNQKAKKIKNFVALYRRHGFDHRAFRGIEPSSLRKELLSVNGIGPETADSILLYGLNVKIFVVDAYTRRIFTRLGLLSGRESYHEIQDVFQRQFKGTVQDYNEYHALIVAHGKDYCKSRPRCEECCLSRLCDKNI
ncbi:MAG TPA: endonuclease [Spirochaetota bacterium]|nr:endonuclease [Spirochaetota bacterium]HPC42417.1 endonuclease [Spirochaetota bacterium]HPL16681.1 endonuclease [Spirochaetota bacterium]HQF06596.1 endonuclease [Spirochaetota bacterium]HQH96001.1 endonuclease [Spirochaetota bacterium]